MNTVGAHHGVECDRGSGDQAELPDETDGEFVARGNIMRGYYKMPEVTQAATTEGWLHTGIWHGAPKKAISRSPAASRT